ncbi:MAG: hypothetical protein BWY73_01560 [candidate division TA06 bacterium ADurb.Bin417]|uniref:Uncharacterized protein n=1 Tax=candidate division TA06 bacterium ADurb.Bin417 TaxID=1852828 RepID=A0A1V5M7E1_UNCT6|nr:MAG: hypothetical protein BWY73_01560 [candidate division TA06 bacterium ADurb.Bin417]
MRLPVFPPSSQVTEASPVTGLVNTLIHLIPGDPTLL